MIHVPVDSIDFRRESVTYHITKRCIYACICVYTEHASMKKLQDLNLLLLLY